MHRRNWGTLALVIVALPAAAQQTGTIVGKVTAKDGRGIANVRIEAASSVMPQPRRVVTAENGEFRLPFLPPGQYTLTFLHSDMAPEKRSAGVNLQQTTAVNVTMAKAAVASAEVEVVAQATLVDTSSAELKTAVSADAIGALPVGHDFRDLIKLIPGVQYSQDATRGPSAGGSGQDNVHQFDGVNVNLPLFGVLSAEPSAHDIDQVAIVKGGAAALDFNRSAGFSVNSISKSGTNTFKGGLSYDYRPDNWVAKRRTVSSSVFEQSLTYMNAFVGGPIVKEKLFFFASYYRPTLTRENRANLYGPVPDLSSKRDEFFLKLTFAPFDKLLLNASHRTSDRKYERYNIGSAAATSVSVGGNITLDISILEGTWSVTPASFVNFKYTKFVNKNQETPDTLFPFKASVGASLNISALETQGALSVPLPRTGSTAPELTYNAFIAPFITKYGYISSTTGLPTGGGVVGGASQINNQDFYRDSWQIAYDITVGTGITHDLHVGYQWSKDAEDLYRISNGWGSLTIPYNVKVPSGLPNAGASVYFQAQVQQQGLLNVPTIRSEYVSQNLEFNDKIRWQNFTFNVGFLMSNDKLYGQGLREKAGTISGFELAAGNKYKMYEIKFADTMQPRLGMTWAYDGPHTVYANWARYIPAASSLPRAASWARNKAALLNVYFDQAGTYLASQIEASSSGKVFASNLKPRTTDELLVGTTRDFGRGLTTRFYGRYRRSYNFWEDTNNNARVDFNPPPGIPRELYVPNLSAIQAEIGGSSFVIAMLDGAFTKYYEVGTEVEWRKGPLYLRGSYVWSHYYGNFDQDNSTSAVSNDAAIFIGSSNIADDGGRQLWDFKYGNLRGDRRHQFKFWGYYSFPWNGKAGAIGVFQSGQPWEYHSYEPYLAIIGTSRSDVNRYAEPAGSRRTRPHSQLDLSYTQGFKFWNKINLELFLQLKNVFNRQTGYNVQENVHSGLAGLEQSFFDPRTMELGVKFNF